MGREAKLSNNALHARLEEGGAVIAKLLKLNKELRENNDALAETVRKYEARRREADVDNAHLLEAIDDQLKHPLRYFWCAVKIRVRAAFRRRP